MKKININSKSIRTLSWLIFIVYILALTKVILFKYSMHMIINIVKENNWTRFIRRVQHNSNYLPLKNIYQLFFSKGNTMYIVRNIIGNIIAFIPLGTLLPILKEKMRKINSILIASLSISISFEVIQLLSGIGDFDINDLILNTSGGLIGLSLYNFLCRYFIDDCH
ncbi:VanZ family protein [Caloranaerobacter ferrireducens]|uniref:VanZ family protein n=1 Tax=Caloranaerobacter ferrireducens TaxID=1323370 RepID=UPI00084DF837|nr:VanZ family protein [Caloranaerobacter ferrireducens]